MLPSATNATTSNSSPNPGSPSNASPPKVSSEFPQGYGDFRVRSSDGADFYLPSALLKWASPVFEDALSLGQRQEKSPNNTSNIGASRDVDEILELPEDEETLELLFRFIDPRKQTGTITQNNVVQLLTASEKYQIVKIPQIVEDWFMSAHLSSSKGVIHDHPMLAFTIAKRFDLPKTIEAATQRLIACPLEAIAIGSLPEIGKLLHRRQKRIDWLLKVCDHVVDAALKPSNLCTTCNFRRTKWITRFVFGVINEPTFASLELKADPESEGQYKNHEYMDANIKKKTCRGPLQGLSYLKDEWKGWRIEASVMEAHAESLV
jgi:hypothetical protein